MLERIVRPGMVFFDLGAHIGEYTLLASRLVTDTGQVHAFEPDPDIFKLLQENVARNKLGNVKLNCCAVSDADGEADFIICADPASSSIIQNSGLQPGPALKQIASVPTRCLDSYHRESECRPNIVKADVEGAELLVLEGAKNTPEVLENNKAADRD